MKKSILLLLSIMILSTSYALDESKTFVMGYKENGKLPFIDDLGNDSGLYKELLKKAAAKIGYTLKIVRLPKKRVHYEFMGGGIDFYPGASFSQNRAKYLYYFPIGFKTKEVLVSAADQKKIESIYDIRGKLMVELGSSKSDLDKKVPGLKIVKMRRLPMETVIKSIKYNRANFYVADIEVINYYKEVNKIENYKELGIKIHYYAVNSEFVPMYLGFSRKSSKFSEDSNPDYDNSKEITIKNFPTIISKKCAAYKLYMALKEMKKEGETQRLYDKYFD